MAAKTKAKASKVTEVKPTEAEVKETVVAQETQTVEENVTDETVKEKTAVEAEITSEPEGEITEGVCVDEIIGQDTCGPMPKSDEDEVCDGDFETIQTDTPDVEEKSVPMDEPQTDVVGIIDMPVPGVELQTDTPDVEEKPVSENKQGNLGYGYVYMWNGMASD